MTKLIWLAQSIQSSNQAISDYWLARPLLYYNVQHFGVNYGRSDKYYLLGMRAGDGQM